MNAGTAVLASNRFRLGNKESQTFGSLDLGKVDFGARMYDPFIAGWTTADPLAAKYYQISPYAYCIGNPIRFFDDGGLDIVIGGANGSSVTITTGLINASVSVEKLGIDWGGNYTFGGYDFLTAALDIAGFVDQSGSSDFINAGVHWGNGHFWGGFVSAVGAIPLVGDLAKAGRIGREVKLFSDAISAAGHVEKHHIIPRAVYKKYKSVLKDILPLNNPDNLIELSAEIGGKGKKYHANHPAYNDYIEKRLKQLFDSNAVTKENVEAIINEARINILKANKEYVDQGLSLNDYFKQLQ